MIDRNKEVSRRTGDEAQARVRRERNELNNDKNECEELNASSCTSLSSRQTGTNRSRNVQIRREPAQFGPWAKCVCCSGE
jgi:hypothetical protein